MFEARTKKIIKDFQHLEAWQSGHEYVLAIYRRTNTFPIYEQYGLTSQLRRAAVSVTANIAEGFDRFHYKDKIKFYYQARGSLAETKNYLLLTKDLGLMEFNKFQELMGQAEKVGRLINGLVSSIKRQL